MYWNDKFKMCILSRNTSIVLRNLHIKGKTNTKSINLLSTKVKPFDEIPGPKSLPLIGTLYQYIPIFGKYSFKKLHINGLKKYKKFGSIVREEIIPGVNIVWLFDPVDIENLFRIEGKCPQRRSHLALEKYRLDRPHIYNTGGLLPTNGPEWLKIRSVFQKGLSSPVSVQNYLQGSNEIINDWIIHIDTIKEENSKDYLMEIARLFLELTCFTVFDIRLNSFTYHELKPYSRSSRLLKSAFVTNSCILKLDNGPQLWKLFETPLYRKLRKSQQYMEDVAIDLLSLKMSIFQDPNFNSQQSLLDTYFNSPELDFKDLIGIVCDFLLAGMDTTSYSTSFLLYYLALNNEVQNKLNKEACTLLPTKHSSVTKDVLSRAVYAKAILKETLRLRPISVGIGRVLDRDTTFSGYLVPSGTVVVTQNQVACRLEKHFESSSVFVPERWLKDNSLYKHTNPFLSLPFGFGPRSCIARRLAEQNMLTLLLKISRNYVVHWSG